MTQDVQDLLNLLNYIEQNAYAIHVRTYLDGRPGNYALSEIPARMALRWTIRFIRGHHLRRDVQELQKIDGHERH